MEAHYGPDIKTCPAAGMLAPELVAGALDDVAKSAWEDARSKLMVLETLPNASPLTDAVWKLLFDDYQSAQSTMMALLAVKTNFWKHIPWLLVGLARSDANVAREIGQKAIQQFDKDPTQAV